MRVKRHLGTLDRFSMGMTATGAIRKGPHGPTNNAAIYRTFREAGRSLGFSVNYPHADRPSISMDGPRCGSSDTDRLFHTGVNV